MFWHALCHIRYFSNFMSAEFRWAELSCFWIIVLYFDSMNWIMQLWQYVLSQLLLLLMAFEQMTAFPASRMYCMQPWHFHFCQSKKMLKLGPSGTFSSSYTYFYPVLVYFHLWLSTACLLRSLFAIMTPSIVLPTSKIESMRVVWLSVSSSYWKRSNIEHELTLLGKFFISNF